MSEAAPRLCDDFIEGVPQMAEFIYGAVTPEKIRRVRYMIQKKAFRTRKVGGIYTALKSQIEHDLRGET